MNIALFYHSLVSDWNHGNAHFLRGILSELLERGHEVTVYEPADAWSRQNLVEQHGLEPIEAFYKTYPALVSSVYTAQDLSFEAIADEVDLVIVHEWNEPWLINGWGRLRGRRSDIRLLFHDTHHRAVSDPDSIGRVELEHYDGILAFGDVLREVYRDRGWGRAAWTWHEAADIRIFHPLSSEEANACAEIDGEEKTTDLIWIGNWGDNERTHELEEYLFGPVRALNLRLQLHGVRYPVDVLYRLARQGVDYRGWLPNFKAPQAFAHARATVHVPRRPYAQTLRGIPTIRPFEALACGIPLISAPWDDSEHLFRPGQDYLVADTGQQMQAHLRAILNDPDLADALVQSGLETIRSRHTCGHRVDELMRICDELGVPEKSAEPLYATLG